MMDTKLATESTREALAVDPLGPLVYAVSELHYAGVDPNALRFNRTHCLDVGVRCGGWGRVIMEVRVE
jgi:hypothetical protein